MHSKICEFPSKTLYSSKLKSHRSVSAHLLRDLPEAKVEPEDEEDVLGTPVIFFDTAGCEYFEKLEGDGDEGSRCNENEAVVVKVWVEKLVGIVLYVTLYYKLIISISDICWDVAVANCSDNTVSCVTNSLPYFFECIV